MPKEQAADEVTPRNAAEELFFNTDPCDRSRTLQYAAELTALCNAHNVQPDPKYSADSPG